jgi:hypothetical protein
LPTPITRRPHEVLRRRRLPLAGSALHTRRSRDTTFRTIAVRIVTENATERKRRSWRKLASGNVVS